MLTDRKPLQALEKSVATLLARRRLRGHQILVCVSGGCDSVSLLEILHRLSPIFRLRLTVAHIHHGVAHNSEHREKVLSLVSDICDKSGIPFRTVTLNSSKEGESQLREQRYFEIDQIARELGIKTIALGHHRDDLLETRLIRLIRGVGPQGLQAMEEFRPPYLRPFLTCSRVEIRDYATQQKLLWFEDPTNIEDTQFRGFLRQHWFPLLEAYRPGGVKILSKSLETICQALEIKEVVSHCHFFDGVRLARAALVESPEEVQKVVIASFLSRNQVKNYTGNHILELMKTLRSKKAEFEFEMLNCQWRVDTQHITLIFRSP